MPVVLPDILLYSVFEQLVACNASGDPRSCMELLLGRRTAIPCTDLPIGVERFILRLGVLSPWGSAEEIIERCTIYPYHRALVSPDRNKTIQEILLHGPGGGLKTLLGRVANGFGASPPLRYCPICAKEDFATFRTLYWHRAHQLPGVLACSIHGTNLVSLGAPGSSTDRQRFVCVPACALAAKAKNSSAVLSAFAKLSRDLLEAGLPASDPEIRRSVYQVAVADKGYSRCNGAIDYDALADDLCMYYDSFREFACRDRLLSTPKHPLAWLRTILQRPERSAHPICHLTAVRLKVEQNQLVAGIG
jgi:hypothetical protein